MPETNLSLIISFLEKCLCKPLLVMQDDRVCVCIPLKKRGRIVWNDGASAAWAGDNLKRKISIFGNNHFQLDFSGSKTLEEIHHGVILSGIETWEKIADSAAHLEFFSKASGKKIVFLNLDSATDLLRGKRNTKA